MCRFGVQGNNKGREKYRKVDFMCESCRLKSERGIEEEKEVFIVVYCFKLCPDCLTNFVLVFGWKRILTLILSNRFA